MFQPPFPGAAFCFTQPSAELSVCKGLGWVLSCALFSLPNRALLCACVRCSPVGAEQHGGGEGGDVRFIMKILIFFKNFFFFSSPAEQGKMHLPT